MARIEAAGLELPKLPLKRTASPSTTVVPLSELMWQPIGVRRAAAIIAELLLALAEWHERGEVHGHLHPGLIQVCTGADGREFVTILPVETIVFSLENAEWHSAYRAPEQLQGAGASVAGDLHAVGVLLYEMLTGHAPAPLEDPTPRLQQHMAAPFPRETRILNPLLAGLADRDPTRRFASAREALASLQRCLSGEAQTQQVPSSAGRAARTQVPSNAGRAARTQAPSSAGRPIAQSGVITSGGSSPARPLVPSPPLAPPPRAVAVPSELHAVVAATEAHVDGDDTPLPRASTPWISRSARVAAILGLAALATVTWMRRTMSVDPERGSAPVLLPAALAGPAAGVLSAARGTGSDEAQAHATPRRGDSLPPPPSLARRADRKDRKKTQRPDRPKIASPSEDEPEVVEALEVEAPPEPEPIVRDEDTQRASTSPGRQVVMTADEAEAWSRMRAGTPTVQIGRRPRRAAAQASTPPKR